MEAPRAEITQLLQQWSLGRQDALDRLLSTIYAELRRLAAAYVERRDHTLQATVMVREPFLKLVDQREVHRRNRAHFFGIAAQMMRRVLVDHAWAKKAAATVDLLTIKETAEVIGISTAAVERDWVLAKAWLHAELGRTTP